jgi:hypothetical protein
MNGIFHIDSEVLIREVVRYLAVVDVFRAERCEPTWRPEPVPRDALRSTRPASRKPRARRSETPRS